MSSEISEQTLAEIGAPPLVGRRLFLRPLASEDYPRLRAIELSGDTLHSYRSRSSTPSPEQFAHSLWSNVLVNFAICDVSSGAVEGNCACYMAAFRNQTAWFIFVLSGERRQAVDSLEVGELFISYLFRSFPFRKLYADVLEPNVGQFSSAVGRVMVQEARFERDVWFQGHWIDRFVFGLWRERWDQLVAAPIPGRRSVQFAASLQREAAGVDG